MVNNIITNAESSNYFEYKTICQLHSPCTPAPLCNPNCINTSNFIDFDKLKDKICKESHLDLCCSVDAFMLENNSKNFIELKSNEYFINNNNSNTFFRDKTLAFRNKHYESNIVLDNLFLKLKLTREEKNKLIEFTQKYFIVSCKFNSALSELLINLNILAITSDLKTSIDRPVTIIHTNCTEFDNIYCQNLN